jgi:hypothetical protein
VLYKNSSILRQQRVGGPSYPDLPPYPVTNSALECTAIYSPAAKFLIAVN